MTSSISRRSVASGLAWSVPAVAVATSAPALAASTPNENCQSNLPADVAPFWPTNGSHGVSSTGGGPGLNVSSAISYAFNDARPGSYSVYFNDGAAQSWVAQPYVTLNNGQTYCGYVSLTGTATFVAPAGVSNTSTVMWYGSAMTADDALWSGVTAHIPFVYWYTDRSDGNKLKSDQYEMLVTYPTNDPFSAGIRPMTIEYVKASYGCQAQPCSAVAPTLRSVSPLNVYPTAGKTMTLAGSNFTGATTVFYGGTKLNFTVVNDTTITATMPNPWPSNLVWGTYYDMVVCNETGCSDGVGVPRG